MDINDLTKGIDKEKFNNTLKQFGNMLSQDDINTVLNTLKNTNKEQLQKQLSRINPNDVNSLLNNNPNLKKAVSSNPELAKNLNTVMSKGKK